MRPCGVPVAALLALSCLVLQVASVEDLYWEGEEDASNEFLEVKREDTGVAGHLNRFKRQFFNFDFFGSSRTTTSTTESPEPYVTDDPDVDEDQDQDHGSGSPDRGEELGEKTLRVTFVVMEPYLPSYSNRDSLEFQNFSRTIGDAVDLLYKSIPGEQKASLVRIQSRISDEFSCKVTLDIVTTNYDDLVTIGNILRDHIKNRHELGVGRNSVKVSDADFTTTDINPNLGTPGVICTDSEILCNDNTCVPGNSRCDGIKDCPDGLDELGCVPDTEVSTCAAYEIQCGDKSCVPGDARCNGIDDCSDGTDEIGCTNDPVVFTDQETEGTNSRSNCVRIPCANSAKTICEEARCDGNLDCPNGDDEEFCGSPDVEIQTPAPCAPTDFRCSDNTCAHESARCNGVNDCPDGADEIGCPADDIEDNTVTPPVEVTTAEYTEIPPLNCPEGEFSCDDTRCVSLSLRCDRKRDCYDGSDEQNCPPESCGEGDFRCASNGKCISARRRCDSVVDCPNEEDEQNCVCREDEFQCASDLSCIEGRKRCDGVNHCRDSSDELNCATAPSACPPDSFTCNPGSSVPCARRCDDRFECDGGEDEENCDACSLFCDGRCLEETRICDGTSDCSDSSDEENCDHCDGPNDYRCKNGDCINTNQYCNGIVECSDNSDEQDCNSTMTSHSNGCSLDEFQCNDGTCINSDFRCDGNRDCLDHSDEHNCGCDKNQWQCNNGACIAISSYCDNTFDCSDESDEKECPITNPWVTPAGPYPQATEASTAGYPNGDYTTRRPDFDRPGTGNDYDSNRLDTNYNRPGQGGSYGGNRPDDRFNNQGGYDRNRPDDPYNNQGGNDRNRPDDRYNNQGGSDRNRPDDRYNSQGGSDRYRPDDRYNSQSGNDRNRPDDRYNSQSGNDRNRPDDRYNRPGQDDNYGRVTTRRPDDGYYGQGQPGFNDRGTTLRPDGDRRGDDYERNGLDDRFSTPGYDVRFDSGRGDDVYNRNPGYGDNGLAGPGTRRNSGPISLNLKTYPTHQTIRNGGDVVFQCRDEGPLRAPVRWVRPGGRPLKPGSTDLHGRLEMNQVTMAENGDYICQAVGYLGHPNAELRVTLIVDPTPVLPRAPQESCQNDEATCANGQCIPKSALCNGVYDCSDRSDEDACDVNGKCEPNQFKCNNKRCVLKTWLCDSEDDCGDGSDELNCGYASPGQCRPQEFACSSGDQCVPKSFHCDGQSDCADKSDEIGCAPVYVTRPPQPSNVILNIGDTLTLNCSATGVPVPLISWRRNWGDVPEVCTSDSQQVDSQVVGTLVCPNMQPEYNGAYSCEAINNKGTIFAVPDAIVFVNNSGVCPSGYFNKEARSQRECIRCFCFGESTSCRSADLFTFNMATPLGQGGTTLVGVKNPGFGDVQLDKSAVTDQYYYQALYNGATVTKLARYGSGRDYSSATPYLTLPDSYNGNQLTSYGGYIRYTIAPHFTERNEDDRVPDIIIKGKYQNLVHYNRGNPYNVEARLVPGNWEKTSSRGNEQATREDIMMALDSIELILIRANLNNAGVNITDFVMQSAHHIDKGLGAASLVEECTCPPGYEGLSCQKCASGYSRARSGRWLGDCVRERTCPPGTYSDSASGYECKPCPCPLTNRENQFARTCSVGPNGNVICDCAPGYQGDNCETCVEGYIGNPLVIGDSCQPKPVSNCNPVGTSHVRLPDECECKDNVQGRYCNQCKNDSFYLSNDFRQGCALCFCSGVSQQCMSSNLRRKTTNVLFNTPSIVDQVKVYSSTPLGASAAARYNAPVETNLTASYGRQEVVLTNYDRNRPAIYYWSLPISFAGDKVTSYGGYLSYTLRNVPPSGYNTKNNAADVQLVSENHLTFHYFGNFEPGFDGTLEASVKFLEKGWQRPDGKEVSREHFLLALADVKAILVKATYTTNSQIASLVSASIDTAEPNGNGPAALHVEQCVCPKGYIGTSCEDCAPGFTRYASGLYLEHCGPCECNGHSICHPETGVCMDCQDNTDGERCELCKPGYIRDPYNNCVPESPNQPCNCDPRGSSGPCDARGNCACKQNVEGPNCGTCRPGTFGLNADNPLGCYSCYCSGATSDCHDASSRYIRIPMAAPVFGANNGGYTLMDVRASTVISDQIVAMPISSELMYAFPFPPNEELYWSLPVFPGNRVLSYGGTLQLKQKYDSNIDPVSEPGTDVILVGESKSLYWSNPQAISAGQALTYKVPLTERGWSLLDHGTPASRNDFLSVLKDLRRVLVRATLVRNIYTTSIADVSMDTATDMNDPASPPATGVEICSCPEGYSGTSCESCTPGYYNDHNGCQRCNCNGHDCYLSASDEVVCNCRPPYTGSDCSILGGSNKPDNATTRPPPPRPSVYVQITSPTIKIQDIGSSVNFTCQAQSRMSSNLPITWTKDNGYLPQGRTQFDDRAGMIIITNLQTSDSGKYICQTSDGISTAQAVATLRVPSNDMTYPTVEIRPPVNEYSEGDRIQLECIASGNPSPTISWQRSSGRPLPQYATIVDDLFIIDNAREEDSGEYRCRVSNALGSADRTAVVTIRPRPSQPHRDKLTVSQPSPTISEGQNTRVTCTGTTNVPAGTIDWVRQDGANLQSNVRSINGVLYIDYARIENQGVYICQTTSYDVQPVLVVVTVIPQGTPSPGLSPNITVSSDSLRIPTGGSGTVDCNPTGYPPPLVKWRKHEGQFGDGTSQRHNTLVISNAKDDDAGYYLCEGTVNGQPIANIYVYVEIEKREAPQIRIYPEGEQAVTLGSPFSLRCHVMAGTPEPLVTWSRAGGLTLSQFTDIQPNNILHFEHVDVNDVGEYSCTATNPAGTASASATIKVRSPPEVTLSPGDFIQVINGDPINVECRANGIPEPLVSIKTSPEMREIVPPTPGIASLHIASASDLDDGDYVCLATSPAGTIEEQFGIRVERGDGGFGAGPDEGSGDITDPEFDPNTGYEQPSDLTAIEGQETLLGCTVDSNALDVEWSREDRRPLQPNALQQGSNLIIRRTSKQDSGRYVCNLLDRYTGEVIKSATTSLRVMAVPKITLQPPTQTVHPGESPTVQCIVDGDDIEEVIWRPLTRSLSSRVEIRGRTLIFNRIEVEDAGKYECFARNRMGKAVAIAEVIVSEDTDRRPSESHDNEQRAHVGAAVHLSCNVQASPAGYRISWTKDGRQIPRTVVHRRDGSLYIRLAQKSDSGHYVCNIQDKYGRRTSNYINLHIDGARPAQEIVSIDQPRKQYRVGDTVQVMCRERLRAADIRWERYGTRQYVHYERSGDGSLLTLTGVQESDAGPYRCIGIDPYGRNSTADFNLEVIPGNPPPWSSRPSNQLQMYRAKQGDSVDMPCTHNLDGPTSYEWRREYTRLQPELEPFEPTLHLQRITEADAGTYICIVKNGRTSVQTRAVLTVSGVVPRFDGNSWISLPTFSEVYTQFDIEITFKPSDGNGMILFNGEKEDGTGDYLSLRLEAGVPQFQFDAGSGVIEVVGDRPLELNAWHTIRIGKTSSKVIMDVDNNGPTSVATPNWDLLELRTPLYIGGVPDYDQLPDEVSSSGFIGCVSMLVLGNQEKNILLDRLQLSNILECDTCNPNHCNANGVCQEARNERGYVCLCGKGYAGLNCDSTGEACKPGLCGPGKCIDVANGYKCACPINYTGKNCDVKQSIEYPAFTGSAYLAIKAPQHAIGRFFRMSMKVKPAAPVTDGIIMYFAESALGFGGFTALTVHNGHLEFIYDLGDGTRPLVLTSNRTLRANEWTDVELHKLGIVVELIVNSINSYTDNLKSSKTDMKYETPIFVGGADDSIVLNKHMLVKGGFHGCIKDVVVFGQVVDIVGSSIQSANVQECSNYDRGDIPEIESICSQCRNGGQCNEDGTVCECPDGFTGQYCETRVPPLARRRPASDPCALQPCRNGGSCRLVSSGQLNYTCDCRLGFAGATCQMDLQLRQSVAFNGNGYIELPSNQLRYDDLVRDAPVIAIAFYTNSDGVLLYQNEVAGRGYSGDFILIRIDRGLVVMEWDLGSGASRVTVENAYVSDLKRHSVIARIYTDGSVSLTVDDSTRNGTSAGFSNVMNADSNIYIGGIPDSINVNKYPGLSGCVEQIELMDADRGLNLGDLAVAGRNTQRCKKLGPE